MKKILATLLAALMLFSFAACGGKEDTSTDGTAETTAAEETTEAAATVEEKLIAEGDEGVGPVKLYNSYLEVTVPEGIGYCVDDANTEEGESQFQLILILRNAEGNEIGELLINNRGGYDNLADYTNSLKDEFKNNTSVTVADVESKKIGLFDVDHITLDRGFMVDNRYIGYYQIADESVEYRNVRLDLELRGYYYTDTPYPADECEAIINSIVIK
jgi:hypothetical protein